MEGDALRWWQWENKRHPPEHNSIRTVATEQTAGMAEYRRKFIEIADMLMGKFVNELKEEIRLNRGYLTR